ncbi:hypothetical protein [Actinospica sp.]|uniref:hypothetical protein n=1 Tax=Actinospica sp. TaxID=1872142 RepID=UPI002CBE88E0|nr:hypothetical protein [Actinospica sp.]HWG25592.1 hypothetical protein [Actinospica sp.]
MILSPQNHVQQPSPNRLSARRKRGWLASAGLASAMVLAASGTATAATAPPTGGAPVSGPAAGGATGIIDATSAAGFTMKTATGVEVTVDETSSTKTVNGPASAVRVGTSVLVLGVVYIATIDATTVEVQRHGDGGAAAAAADGVVPFQPGVPSPVKSVGTIPAAYTEGVGTLVSGTAADKAVEAAQVLFPGGVVDRVVLLSDGSYEVHNSSVNWPHHVFVTAHFKVQGAE